ncbi:GNAT family N-acetyltransferase [Solimicrobium silvestre]|nr:GNAT family N-acetyltransferase [Solimicrobium silvestre]
MKYQALIRKFEHRDLNELAQLFDAYRQFYEQAPDLALAEHYLATRVEKRESVILVAENSAGGLSGFCQLYPTFCSVLAQPIYVLYDLFVSPEARGNGVAKHLLNAARELGISDGKARLDLTTAKTNSTAQSLYASLGWVRDEEFYTYNLTLD